MAVFPDSFAVSEQVFGLPLEDPSRGFEQNDEYLIVMTNTLAYCALNNYQRRWSIETFFQSVKQRGFRLEDTHLNDLERLRKLFALVAIARAASALPSVCILDAGAIST